jgi:acylphosphatase
MKISKNIPVKHTDGSADIKRVSISLSGRLSIKINYTFEVYRLAVKLNLKGFVRRIGDENLDIEAEGDSSSLDYFKEELQVLLSKSDFRITFTTKDYLLNYHEFRILKH